MNNILREHLGKYCLVYMDDVLIYSKTPQMHMLHLRALLQTLRDAQFYCKLSKCSFALQQVQFLGHLTSSRGVEPNPVKVHILQERPSPSTAKDLRSLLGLAQYFSEFIPAYAVTTICLQTLLRKDAVWDWNGACVHAIQTVKQDMATAPV